MKNLSRYEPDHKAATMFICSDGNYIRHDEHVAALGAMQAKIDVLMLEYCPDEMTDEQREEWGRNQRRLSPEMEAQIEAFLPSRKAEASSGWRTSSDGLSRVRAAPDAAAPMVPSDSRTVLFKY